MTESIVILRLYETGIGSCKANEPIKCIAHIPMPSDIAPNSTQSFFVNQWELELIRSDVPKAENDETIAITTDKTTRYGLYTLSITVIGMKKESMKFT